MAQTALTTPPGRKAEPLELADMQGLVARAYGHLPFARYIIGRFGDPAAARAWLAGIARDVCTADQPEDDGPSLNIAFSWDGLRRLGLADDALASFPRPLQEGMVTPHRSRILGDHGASDPSRWRFGRPDSNGAGTGVDVVLILYALTEEALEAEHAARRGAYGPAGALLEIADPIDGRLLDGREHFGFADGLSQPFVPGLHARPRPGEDPNADVKLDAIKGITIAGMDWKAKLKDAKPQPDALAKLIPADQPAMFFPSLSAAAAIADASSSSASWPRMSLVSATTSRSPPSPPVPAGRRWIPTGWRPRWWGAGRAGRPSSVPPTPIPAPWRPVISATTTRTRRDCAARSGPTSGGPIPGTAPTTTRTGRSGRRRTTASSAAAVPTVRRWLTEPTPGRPIRSGDSSSYASTPTSSGSSSSSSTPGSTTRPSAVSTARSTRRSGPSPTAAAASPCRRARCGTRWRACPGSSRPGGAPTSSCRRCGPSPI